MWIFRELAAFRSRWKWGTPLRFRLKLTLLLMVVVGTATVLAIVYANRAEQTASQQSLQDKFEGRLGVLFEAEAAREAAVSEQGRLLAKSVRIQAALEEAALDESDVEDLYANARIELRNVLGPENGPTPERTGAPRATFFRFLNADGKLLAPPATQQKVEPWESQLGLTGSVPETQQIGYVARPAQEGGAEINEVVVTPILGAHGETVAALVLGFPSIDLLLKPDPDLKTGLWLGAQLYMPGLAAEERDALSAGLVKIVGAAPSTDNRFAVEIQGVPHLLFYRVLNPKSVFPPAYEVCLYSLAEPLAQQERVRWRIVGIAILVLIVGTAVSQAFSAQLSRPVEQLEEVSAQNVTRREEAEAAREMTERKYQSIFENAVEGIFLLTPEGRFLSANPAMARIFGYASPDELVAENGRQIGLLYVEPDLGRSFLQRAATEGTVSNFECEMKRRDGSTLWIAQNVRAVRKSSEELLHLEGTLEDITERKEAADSLRTVNGQLQKALADLKATQNQIIQQERLRALGQMASGIAHDFNNSLMPVTGFAELLLAKPEILEDRKKATGYLEMIRTASKDAASIVARLREFYRTNEQSDVFTPVVLSQLARQVIALTQPKWKGQAQASGAAIRIVEELGEVPAISGEEPALREVFTNLIFNAVDAMPKGGTLTVRTLCEGDRVKVEIADTGVGMSDEVRQHCLEPFFTTKGDGGTGLGLSMVFGIVQRHGGTIELQSQLGQGTTFVLEFPVRAAVTAKATGPLPTVAQSPGLRILLVDDEPQVREVLTAFLELDGHEVHSAGSGQEGLRRLSTGPCDLVITDQAMPGMSGEQMVIEMQRVYPKLPVVLLSGFHAAGENAAIPGVKIIASKPITIAALREAVRQAMEAA